MIASLFLLGATATTAGKPNPRLSCFSKSS